MYLVSVGGVRVCERVFSVGFGPGLDSMSPAKNRHSASHAAGMHDWLPQKTGWLGLRRGGVGGYNLHTNHEQAVSVWFFLCSSSSCIISVDLHCYVHRTSSRHLSSSSLSAPMVIFQHSC